MASRDGEGSPPAIDQDEQQSIPPESPENDESGSESGSSYDGTASGPGTPACTYRNSQFHDQECSRYFDCPTHQIERAQFDDDSHQLEGREESDEEQPIAPDSQDTPPEDISLVQPAGPADIMSVPTSVDTATDDQASAGTQQASGTDQPAAESNIDQEDTAEIAPEEEAGADLNNAASTTDESSPPREPAADNDLAIRRGVQQLVLDSPLPTTPTPSSSTRTPTSTMGAYVRRPSSGHYGQAELQPAQRRATTSSPSPHILLPTWQPDSEVTSCTICHSEFGLINRKHHCRKCGRVVCNSCSPHRITIPNQYIVRPPWDMRSIPPYVGYGGERVRLCNPCVPDPNVTPPQPQLSPSSPPYPFNSPRSRHQRSQSSVGNTGYYYNGSSGLQSPTFMNDSSRNDIWSSRNRSATVNHLPRSRPVASGPQLSASLRSSHYLPPPPGAMYRSLDAAAELGRFERGNPLFPGGSNRPLPVPPVIAEEDQCPICHQELPSRTLPDFEKLREEHITACINEHSTSRREPASGGQTPLSETSSRPQRSLGLVSYVADEKDRASKDECTICFEGYEPGERMARLECWCCFHYDCIKSWFDRRGHALCPVHQHDTVFRSNER
ncbi:putative A kinase anchor protein [Pestalotiopsis sp. NC0098]|nr:putative A kinase anchor protein [Pestalotiopsis sp. NC0098]